MSEPQFHFKLLSNYQLVTKPGTYYVSVAYDVHEGHLILDEYPRYIVPLRAITGEGLVQIMEALNVATGGLVPYSSIRHCFLSGAMFCNEGDLLSDIELPIKGEKVIADFDYVEIDGEKKLLCKHIKLLPREELDYVDIDKLDQFRSAINNLINKA